MTTEQNRTYSFFMVLVCKKTTTEELHTDFKEACGVPTFALLLDSNHYCKYYNLQHFTAFGAVFQTLYFRNHLFNCLPVGLSHASSKFD